ncbi:amidohydrolase family protein [candidate division WOR-3 bacterium]|nr:amidohydrolase family protein [candidate division WOR-3 bacterium]
MKEIIFRNCLPFSAYRLSDILVQDGIIKDISVPKKITIEGTEEKDLLGKPVLPGFTDCHTHLSQWGLSLSGPYLANASNKEECLDVMASFIKNNPASDHYLACDYDESLWKPPGKFTKEDLDSLSSVKPLVARRVCGHLAVANTPALTAISEKAPFLQGFRKDMTDIETGVLKEIPVLRINEMFPPDDQQFMDALKKAVRKYFSMGVTSVGEITSNASRKKILSARDLKLRFRFAAVEKDFMSLYRNQDEGMEHITALKIFLDGSIGARTAAVSFPWLDTGKSDPEALLISDADVISYVRSAVDAGKKVWMHAIGDRAISQALGAFEAFGDYDKKNFRIEHFELPSEKLIERAAEIGVYLSMQPNFIRAWSGPAQLYEKCLPENILKNNNPLSKIEKAGCRLCFGSDTMPPGPLWGIHGAINAFFESQKVNLENSIKHYTLDSAQSLGDFDRGEIKKEKRADFVVLSEIPRDTNLDSLKIEQVYIDGDLVYD